MWSSEANDRQAFLNFIESNNNTARSFSEALQNNQLKEAIEMIINMRRAYYADPDIKTSLLNVIFYVVYDGQTSEFLKNFDNSSFADLSWSWSTAKTDRDIDWVIPANITILKQLYYLNGRSLKILGHIDSIETSCFDGCIFETVEIQDVSEIKTNAFANCANLRKVSIGGDLTAIPIGCFNGCVSLKDVSLGENIVKIYPKAFKNCSENLSIELKKPIRGISMTQESYKDLKSHIKWVD